MSLADLSQALYAEEVDRAWSSLRVARLTASAGVKNRPCGRSMPRARGGGRWLRE